MTRYAPYQEDPETTRCTFVRPLGRRLPMPPGTTAGPTYCPSPLQPFQCIQYLASQGGNQVIIVRPLPKTRLQRVSGQHKASSSLTIKWCGIKDTGFVLFLPRQWGTWQPEGQANASRIPRKPSPHVPAVTFREGFVRCPWLWHS